MGQFRAATVTFGEQSVFIRPEISADDRTHLRDLQATQVFWGIAALFFFPGLFLSFRFLYYFFTGDGDGHVQSVILSVFLMSVGFSLAMMAVLAELISVNRQLLEKLGYRQQLAKTKLDESI